VGHVVGLIEDHRVRHAEPVEPQKGAERGHQQRARPPPEPAARHRRNQPRPQRGCVPARVAGHTGGAWCHHRATWYGGRGASVTTGMKQTGPGTLIVAASPIGRPGDASPRLASALAVAAVIAAEDTRRVRRLAAALGVTLAGRIVSYYDGVEQDRVAGLLASPRAGVAVL